MIEFIGNQVCPEKKDLGYADSIWDCYVLAQESSECYDNGKFLMLQRDVTVAKNVCFCSRDICASHSRYWSGGTWGYTLYEVGHCSSTIQYFLRNLSR